MPEALRLTVLVVDDEAPARRKVRRLLDGDPDVAVVLDAPDGPHALAAIRDSAPDVVFLDIQMPGLSGLQVAESLPAHSSPRIVFVTAFDDFAVRAFDLSATDYLLKPFDAERFARALGRAKDAIRSRDVVEDAGRVRRMLVEWQVAVPAHLDRVAVDLGGRTVLVPIADVDRFEAERNYVRVSAKGTSYRLRGTVTELEGRLDPARFARVGRGTIVNLDRVVDLVPAGHGDFDVRLRDGTRLRMSRRYRDRLDRFRG